MKQSLSARLLALGLAAALPSASSAQVLRSAPAPVLPGALPAAPLSSGELMLAAPAAAPAAAELRLQSLRETEPLRLEALKQLRTTNAPRVLSPDLRLPPTLRNAQRVLFPAGPGPERIETRLNRAFDASASRTALNAVQDEGRGAVAAPSRSALPSAARVELLASAAQAVEDQAGSGIIGSFIHNVKRLLRAVVAWFGKGVSTVENPEVLLTQYVEDLKASEKQHRDAVAQMMAFTEGRRARVQELEEKVSKLEAQIQSGAKLVKKYKGTDQEAKFTDGTKSLIAEQSEAKEALQDAQEALAGAEARVEQAKSHWKESRKKKEERIREAKKLVAENKQAEVDEQLAELGVIEDDSELADDAFSRAKERIEEKKAKAKARLDLATEKSDTAIDEITKATIESGVEDEFAARMKALEDGAGSGIVGSFFENVKRLLRALVAWFGKLVGATENPEVLLQQYMEDLRASEKQHRDAVAQMMAFTEGRRARVQELEEKVSKLEGQIQSGMKLVKKHKGTPEEAKFTDGTKSLIAEQTEAKDALQDAQEALAGAEARVEQAKAHWKESRKKKEARIREAKKLVAENKQAEVDEQLAELGVIEDDSELADDAFSRAKERIEEKKAKAKARLDLATEKSDTAIDEITKATIESGVEDEFEKRMKELEGGSGS